jgi:hypothetical protein
VFIKTVRVALTVNDSDGLVFIGEVLDCRLGENVKGST